MHNNCMHLYRTYGHYFVYGRVLEVGPDAFPSSLQQASANYTDWATADIGERSELTYPHVGDHVLPIPDDTFDCVISANVLEHVKFPWLWIKELARVLQPGGHLVTVAPASYVYHAHPVDCWRIWPEGMRSLYGWAELSIVTVQQSQDENAGEAWPVVDVLCVGRKPLRRE